MERKEFIKTCGFICFGGIAVSAILEGCATSSYFAKTTSSENRISIAKTEFETIENGKKNIRKFVLVKSDKFHFPICIYKIGEDVYSALSLECTHKGCELKPQGEYLVCPCHGSEFTNTGAVQNPPAEQNLQTFKTTTDHENIYLYI